MALIPNKAPEITVAWFYLDQDLNPMTYEEWWTAFRKTGHKPLVTSLEGADLFSFYWVGICSQIDGEPKPFLLEHTRESPDHRSYLMHYWFLPSLRHAAAVIKQIQKRESRRKA